MFKISRVQINALVSITFLAALAGAGLYIGLTILKDVVPSYQALDEAFLVAVFAFPTACAAGIVYCAKEFADKDEPNGNGNGKEDAIGYNLGE